VIGPLVVSGVLADESQLKKLMCLGVADSKKLSRSRREELFFKIKAICQINSVTVPPQELDRNLTMIEIQAMTQIINELKPDLTLIDAPVGPKGIDAFSASLVCKTKLTVENRADEQYPIVSAASIIAKVERDLIIKELRERWGDFGWGYPSEKKTQRFLREWHRKHGSFPKFVRQRWRTLDKMK
jgi:ribonuclease HII